MSSFFMLWMGENNLCYSFCLLITNLLIYLFHRLPLLMSGSNIDSNPTGETGIKFLLSPKRCGTFPEIDHKSDNIPHFPPNNFANL